MPNPEESMWLGAFYVARSCYFQVKQWTDALTLEPSPHMYRKWRGKRNPGSTENKSGRYQS